jgi:hypothetical protein
VKIHRSSIGNISPGTVQTVIKFYLLLHGKLFSATPFMTETDSASVVAAPLAVGAVRAGVLFVVICHGASYIRRKGVALAYPVELFRSVRVVPVIRLQLYC